MLSGDDIEDEARIARAALVELLEHMEVEADVDVYHANSAPHEDDAPWILDVRGNDLGILIGRHGETLNALQYITRLIVSRELQRRANIVVDVEGYKARREIRCASWPSGWLRKPSRVGAPSRSTRCRLTSGV